MEIKPLTQLSFDALYAAWNKAFKDYVRHWTKEELATMLHRHGYVPELSFGAFDNNELVSFTLNAIGEWNGQRTTYDTGTGTIPAYRGIGLATGIFNASVPFLIQAGMKQYLLEVLQDNTKAISIYKAIGFTEARSLNYFVQDMATLKLNDRAMPVTFQLHTMSLPGVNELSELADYQPSWQNSQASLLRKPEDFIVVGAFNDDTLIGYGIIAPSSGDIPQLLVLKAYRRLGIGSAILKELLQFNRAGIVKIINTDASYEPITAFLQNNGIPKRGAQYEMIKQLNKNNL